MTSNWVSMGRWSGEIAPGSGMMRDGMGCANIVADDPLIMVGTVRSEEHTSEPSHI